MTSFKIQWKPLNGSHWKKHGYKYWLFSSCFTRTAFFSSSPILKQPFLRLACNLVGNGRLKELQTIWANIPISIGCAMETPVDVDETVESLFFRISGPFGKTSMSLLMCALYVDHLSSPWSNILFCSVPISFLSHPIPSHLILLKICLFISFYYFVYK